MNFSKLAVYGRRLMSVLNFFQLDQTETLNMSKSKTFVIKMSCQVLKILKSHAFQTTGKVKSIKE